LRVIQVSEAGGPLELREREIPEPASGEVRVRVQACGVCHSDSYPKEGRFPGVSYPVVPGHEVAGVVDAIGDGVHGWTVGERVGVGWFGGNCGYCEPCRRGDFVNCQNKPIPGVTADGGYADYLVCRAAALARVPDDLPAEEAAPLMCAGVTTFNALRHSGARAGGLVAILGIGGLGHLGVQFAVRLGFETVAIARGREKEELAGRLGAHHYIDSEAEDVGGALLRLGGAVAILATVTSASAMSAAFGGLAVRGKMIVVGASGEPLAVTPGQLIGGNRSIHGHASGSSMDSQDTLAFSALTAVRPMIETMPLEDAADAYARMMGNKARFRMVLVTGS
jgi:D-arabinose 1-dehydrogenase-like Zn-dependent alcohol dehydrogenase